MKASLFRHLLISLLFLATVASAAQPEFVAIDQAPAIGARDVVCTVVFAANSYKLSPEAKQILDRHAEKLKGIDAKTKLVRIEGFSSPEGNKQVNFRLSIDRARSVTDYMRRQHDLNIDHYLSGFGPVAAPGLTGEQARRVEIAIYDNPWDIADIPIETTGGK